MKGRPLLIQRYYAVGFFLLKINSASDIHRCVLRKQVSTERAEHAAQVFFKSCAPCAVTHTRILWEKYA